MKTIVIRPKPPYDFSRFILRFEHISHNLYRLLNNSLIRTIRVGGNIYLIRVASTGDVDTPELQVDIVHNSEDVSEQDLQPVIRHVEKLLSVHVDLDTYYRHLRHQVTLSPLADKLYGLRILLDPDPFECLVRTIIGQQLNLAFAATLNRRLIELVSKPVDFAGVTYPVFPSAEEIARLSYGQLRELQFSQRKAEYVIDFAREVASGKLLLSELEAKENGEILELLIRCRGIGRWTVECFLMFCLGRPDVLPAADIGLRNAVKLWYKLPDQPTEQDIRAIGADWSPWSSYITFYLWESLNG